MMLDVNESGLHAVSRATTRSDAEARERLALIYDAESSRLIALGRLLTGSVETGEDLAHDVFAIALRRTRDDAAYLRDPAWPWLRVTLVRLAVRRRVQLAQELRRLVRVGIRQPEDVWSRSTLDYVAALATLPVRMRACAALFYGEDMATAQVAEALGCSSRTVENQLRVARQRLAPLLAVEGV